MSSEQADLDFYTGIEVLEEKPNWQPIKGEEESPRWVACSCGERVSRDFARVFGNNDEELENGCPSCATYSELASGSNSSL